MRIQSKVTAVSGRRRGRWSNGMRIKAALPSLLLTLTWMAVPAATRADASGGDEGAGTRLVWSRFVDLDFSAARIVIADEHGHHVRELTDSADGVQDIDPQVSPDGRWVAFERDLPNETARIVVVGTNGRHERVLDLGCDDPCAADSTPSWTPDGRHIVFTRVVGPFDQVNGSARSAVLFRSDLHGRHVVRMSEPGIDGAFEDYHASFAPGGYITFVRVRNADVKSAVFRMDRDGTHVRRLTAWSLDADLPSVSPATNGPTRDLVVFETFGQGPPEGTAQAVATVPADCRSVADCTAHIRYLTSPTAPPVQNFNPAWSPNGRRIAFVKVRFAEPAPPRGDIWTMRWDGSRRERVSRSPLFEFRPGWGIAPHHRKER